MVIRSLREFLRKPAGPMVDRFGDQQDLVDSQRAEAEARIAAQAERARTTRRLSC